MKVESIGRQPYDILVIKFLKIIFTEKKFSKRKIVKHFFIQKILRVNSHVDWPVHWTTKVAAPKNIDRGTRFPGLSAHCHIDARNGIQFGENVWIGPAVKIISMNHDSLNYKKYLKADPIKIMKNCWLGANVIILPSVVLGEHTIVAAGAVVTQSFPKGNQVLAGVPAKVIKELDAYDNN